MPLGDILKGLAGEAVKSTVRGTFREHKNYADYEKEIAAKMASDDASHSAKERTGLTVDEAEDLIEESRDSAVTEAQKRTNQEQHKKVLLLLLALIAYAVLVGPEP